MSGTITAVFKWVPNANDPYDLPPSQVIAVEKTTVSISASYPINQTPSITLDDGIDAPVTLAKPYNRTLNGQRVTIQGGATITLTCAPRVIDNPPMPTPGGINSASVSYSVDLVYPQLDLVNCVTDPKSGIGLAAPIGQGIFSTIFTNSVFNSINGTVTNALWSTSSDACAGFKVVSGASGTFLPFVAQDPNDPTIDEWYYFKGAPQDGEPTQEPVSVDVTLSALGHTASSTLSEQIYLYGPIPTSDVTAYRVGPISSVVSQ